MHAFQVADVKNSGSTTDHIALIRVSKFDDSNMIRQNVQNLDNIRKWNLSLFF